MKAEIKTNMILGLIGTISGIVSITTSLNWLISLPIIISIAVFSYNLDIFHQIKKDEAEKLKKQQEVEQERLHNIANGKKYHL